MTADLWLLAAAGCLVGGLLGWLARRRRRAANLAKRPLQNPLADLPACEGIGPPREPQQD